MDKFKEILGTWGRFALVGIALCVVGYYSAHIFHYGIGLSWLASIAVALVLELAALFFMYALPHVDSVGQYRIALLVVLFASFASLGTSLSDVFMQYSDNATASIGGVVSGTDWGSIGKIIGAIISNVVLIANQAMEIVSGDAKLKRVEIWAKNNLRQKTITETEKYYGEKLEYDAAHQNYLDEKARANNNPTNTAKFKLSEMISDDTWRAQFLVDVGYNQNDKSDFQ